MSGTKTPAGWFSSGDTYSYRKLVETVPEDGLMVEIGCWIGRSICSVARQLPTGLHLHIVDPFVGPPNDIILELLRNYLWKYGITGRLPIESTFLNEPNDAARAFARNQLADNLREFDINATIHSAISSDTVNLFEDASIDLVFIDGDHSKVGVHTDLTGWWPKVKPGGIIAGHDYQKGAGRDPLYHHVRTVIDDFFGPGRVEKNTRQPQTTVWHVRKETVT